MPRLLQKLLHVLYANLGSASMYDVVTTWADHRKVCCLGCHAVGNFITPQVAEWVGRR